MAKRKITRKVHVVEPDNSKYIYEWTVDDYNHRQSATEFIFIYENQNYYFTKALCIGSGNNFSIGDKFEFDLKQNSATYHHLFFNDVDKGVLSTGTASEILDFIPGHKWSDSIINIGADAENVICSDGTSVQEKLNNLSGSYVEKTGDTMTGLLTIPSLVIGNGIAGTNAYAQGSNGVVASGNNSHAEGNNTTASGTNSHAEGNNTIASGNNAHAEGINTTVSGDGSHAEGYMTIANGKYQHVEGRWNIADPSTASGETTATYVHMIGNGTGTTTRSNAHTLDWSGNAWFSGNVYVGSTSGTNRDDGSKKLLTEDDIHITAITNQEIINLFNS